MTAAVSAPPLRWSTKIAYAVGGIPSLVEQRAISAFLLIFYNQVVGLPAHLVAAVLLVVSIFDALFDPIIGQISDNYRSRWGRRHPFIYVSIIPVSLAFLLLWCPPVGWSHAALVAWLAVTLLAVRFFDTCYELPLSALLPELTSDYDERTRVISLRTLLGLLGAISLMIVAYRVLLPENQDGTGGILARDGYFSLGLTGAIVIAVGVSVAALGTHSRIPYLTKPIEQARDLRKMLREVGATIGNRSYLALLAAGMMLSVGNGSRLALETYFNLYFWRMSQVQIAGLLPATLIGIVVGVAAVSYVSKRLDKRRTAIIAVAGATFGNVGPVLARLAGIMPENGTSALFYILFADLAFTFTLATMTTILLTSMMSDVVEDVAVKTGRRSEGLLLAADNLFKKLVSSIGVFIAGVMITIIGFPQGAERDAVPAEIVDKLAFGYVPIAILYLAGLCSLFLYRIDREKHEANIETLRVRKDAESPVASSE